MFILDCITYNKYLHECKEVNINVVLILYLIIDIYI